MKRMNEIVKMARKAPVTIRLQGEDITIDATFSNLVMLGGGYYIATTTDGRKLDIAKGQQVETV